MSNETELAEILDQCLEQIRRGAAPVAVLREHPEVAAQLRPLLGIAGDLQSLPEPTHSLAGVMKTMMRALEQYKREQSAAVVRWYNLWRAPLLSRAATIALVAVLLWWGGGVASSNAMPGDFLYPFKLLTERVKFYLTLNTEDKAELRIVFSSERLREAVQKHQRDGTLDPHLLQQMLEEARQAVELSLGLPKTSRELLVAQTEHLSRFQGQALEQFKQQLPAQEQAVVAPYVATSNQRATWMRQMCDDWRGEAGSTPAPMNPKRWMDMCPDCD